MPRFSFTATWAALSLFAAACTVAPTGTGARINPALRDELLTMRGRDQEVRALPASDRPEDAARMARWREVDAENLRRLRAIVEQHGWPTRDLVGSEASRAAAEVAQHADADPAFQRRCVELMEKAVAAGQASPGALAYLTDRTLVNEGKPQRYGTQFTIQNGEVVPHPIEDAAGVDRRRAAVGLPPMEEYRRRLLSAIAEIKAGR